MRRDGTHARTPPASSHRHSRQSAAREQRLQRRQRLRVRARAAHAPGRRRQQRLQRGKVERVASARPVLAARRGDRAIGARHARARPAGERGAHAADAGEQVRDGGVVARAVLALALREGLGGRVWEGRGSAGARFRREQDQPFRVEAERAATRQHTHTRFHSHTHTENTHSRSSLSPLSHHLRCRQAHRVHQAVQKLKRLVELPVELVVREHAGMQEAGAEHALMGVEHAHDGGASSARNDAQEVSVLRAAGCCRCAGFA